MNEIDLTSKFKGFVKIQKKIKKISEIISYSYMLPIIVSDALEMLMSLLLQHYNSIPLLWHIKKMILPNRGNKTNSFLLICVNFMS